MDWGEGASEGGGCRGRGLWGEEDSGESRWGAAGRGSPEWREIQAKRGCKVKALMRGIWEWAYCEHSGRRQKGRKFWWKLDPGEGGFKRKRTLGEDKEVGSKRYGDSESCQNSWRGILEGKMTADGEAVRQTSSEGTENQFPVTFFEQTTLFPWIALASWCLKKKKNLLITDVIDILLDFLSCFVESHIYH